MLRVMAAVVAGVLWFGWTGAALLASESALGPEPGTLSWSTMVPIGAVIGCTIVIARVVWWAAGQWIKLHQRFDRIERWIGTRPCTRDVPAPPIDLPCEHPEQIDP